MDRPDYFDDYSLNWEAFEVLLGERSPLDTSYYLAQVKGKAEVERFLKGYGFDVSDPIQSAELFGIFQEAAQFVKRYFLKEGNPEGLDLMFPPSLYQITDVTGLFLKTTFQGNDPEKIEEALWAGLILKVMHTILHADKDLRYRYFTTIQTQIFDRFYRYLNRDEKNELYLAHPRSESRGGKASGLKPIPLVQFETKAKKARDSIIIKLLHKKENVAEELFDRVGLRFVTKNVFDVFRVMKFLTDNHILIVSNVKSGRAVNSLINFPQFREQFFELLKTGMREDFSEEKFLQMADELARKCPSIQAEDRANVHSSEEYRAIHFTCRQLIQFRHPFVEELKKLKKIAQNDSESSLSQRIFSLNTSSINRDIRFFYPFEVQIVDEQSHMQNTAGEASHREYKKSQLLAARERLFRPLLEMKSGALKELK